MRQDSLASFTLDEIETVSNLDVDTAEGALVLIALADSMILLDAGTIVDVLEERRRPIGYFVSVQAPGHVRSLWTPSSMLTAVSRRAATETLPQPDARDARFAFPAGREVIRAMAEEAGVSESEMRRQVNDELDSRGLADWADGKSPPEPARAGPSNAPPSNPVAGDVHAVLVPLGYLVGSHQTWRAKGTEIRFEVEGSGNGSFRRRLTLLELAHADGSGWRATHVRISSGRLMTRSSGGEWITRDLRPRAPGSTPSDEPSTAKRADSNERKWRHRQAREALSFLVSNMTRAINAQRFGDVEELWSDFVGQDWLEPDDQLYQSSFAAARAIRDRASSGVRQPEIPAADARTFEQLKLRLNGVVFARGTGDPVAAYINERSYLVGAAIGDIDQCHLIQIDKESVVLKYRGVEFTIEK